MENCIFCKISNKEAPSTIVWEDEYVVAFKDLYPMAKTHILVVPKQHISSLGEVTDRDELIMGKLLCAIPKVARALNLDHFKVECHTGKESGQTVFHIHLHILQR